MLLLYCLDTARVNVHTRHELRFRLNGYVGGREECKVRVADGHLDLSVLNLQPLN